MELEKETRPLSERINYNAPINVLYYVLFGLFFNFHFMRSTMFSKERLYVYNEIFELWYNRLTTVMLVFAVFTIIFIIPKIRYKLLSVALIVVMMLYTKNREIITYKYSLVFGLLIVCSYGKSYKKIGLIAFISGWIWIIVSAIASQTGYISDIVYRGGRSHSFGSIYSTDLMCHVLTLTMAYYIVRRGKLTIWEYMISFMILGIDILFLEAKIGFACMFLLIVGTFIYQHILPKQKIPTKFTRDLFAVSTFSFVIFAILMYILTITYTSNPKLPVNSIGVLKTIKLRFIYGQRALAENPITLWGVPIREVGNGGVQEGSIAKEDYFFIDISYLRILLKEGVVVFITIMSLFFVAEVRLFKKKDYYTMFVLFVFALDCAVEHHIMEAAYSVLIYLAYCDLDAEKPTDIGVKSWLPLQLRRTRQTSRDPEAVALAEKNCP